MRGIARGLSLKSTKAYVHGIRDTAQSVLSIASMANSKDE